MNRVYMEKIFSRERMQRYFDSYPDNETKSIIHYKCNIEIAEVFYPCLSILEVALRNSINRELTKKFCTTNWSDVLHETPGLGKLATDIKKARFQLTKRDEPASHSKIIAELTLGFWVKLFNTEFEKIIWKDLRRCFPNLPKSQRKRHIVSGPLNHFRLFRNRVFHNEPICWDLSRLIHIHNELTTLMSWINKDLPDWITSIDRFPHVIKSVKNRLE